MNRTWEYLEYWRKVKRGYYKKLRELQTYGKENKIPERIQDIKDSIRTINNDINKAIKNDTTRIN